MTTLMRTRTVLTRDPTWDGHRRYTAHDDETGVLRRAVTLDPDTYEELGKPDTITISIEPGDTLNGQPPPYCMACA